MYNMYNIYMYMYISISVSISIHIPSIRTYLVKHMTTGYSASSMKKKMKQMEESIRGIYIVRNNNNNNTNN